MVKAKAECLEIFLLILGILIISSILTSSQPLENSYVPNAITSLTTLTGILAAFIGFWLTHAYSNPKDEESKKWMNGRIKVIVFLVSISLILVGTASTELAYGRLENAFKFANSGTIIVSLVLAEILYIIAIGE